MHADRRGGQCRALMLRRRTIIELTAAGGALLALVLAREAPPRCTGGVGGCVLGVAGPYAERALAGALLGLVAAALLLATWQPRDGRRAVATPVREPIPERVRHEVWRRDRGACVDCGSRARLEFDHIVPVSRGGSNTARNVELRCEPCNRRKGARI